MKFLVKIKEGLKDPKKKALTQLGIYGVFFIFVFILISSGNSANSNYTDYVEEVSDTVTSYEYIYKINSNEVINQIVGTLKNNEDTFNYNGLNYNKKDGIIYFNNNPVNIDFDVDKYKYGKIELLIENSDSQTTYKDSKKVVYNLSADKYFSLLNETSICSTIDCATINIPITVEADNYINFAIIDLSNYYGCKYNIEINYNNINNVQ